jgi:hypothetical protein
VGVGQSVFEGSLLGKVLGFSTRIVHPNRIINKVIGRERLFEDSPFDERTRQILTKSEVPVGVFIDKKLAKIERVFIPIRDESDQFLFQYINTIGVKSDFSVSVCPLTESSKSKLQNIDSSTNFTQILDANEFTIDQMSQNDLLLMSNDCWKWIVDTHPEWLNNTPSVLVISNK